jgi:hypothetical protein
MQDADAARRLAILRGESPPPPPPPPPDATDDPSDKKHLHRSRGGLRKRKRAGEDDTVFEMRVARERAEEGDRVRGELAIGAAPGPGGGWDVDIVDGRGHIDLVGDLPKDAGEQEGKKREVVDRNTFGSLKGDFAGEPWYTDTKRRRITAPDPSTALVPHTAATTTKDRDAERGMEAPTKNVWGRDDPKRRGRETARLDANDPLAAMKSGAKKVRDIAKERKQDAEERSRELEQLRKEERRREKRRKGEKTHTAEDRREGEDKDDPRRESHRLGRSERRHHGDERREDRRDHVHREERRQHRETEHGRDREKERHHRRDRERSRERGTSSRSHRHGDRDDGRERRGRDRGRQDREALTTE